jgi:hypothetical protein
MYKWCACEPEMIFIMTALCAEIALLAADNLFNINMNMPYLAYDFPGPAHSRRYNSKHIYIMKFNYLSN